MTTVLDPTSESRPEQRELVLQAPELRRGPLLPRLAEGSRVGTALVHTFYK